MKTLIERTFGALMIAMVALWAVAPAAAKDNVEVEVKGSVQSVPASGLVGDYKIAGQTVHASATTRIDQTDGKIGVGALVEVKGAARTDGSVDASQIDVKQGVGTVTPSPTPSPTPTPTPVVNNASEFTGAIESLPASGLVGDWKVAGKTVKVVSTTRLDQEHGGFAVGTVVEVKGLADAAGIVTASQVETKSGGAVTPTPAPVAASLELQGTIEKLPATGLIGSWTVTGKTVTVDAKTQLNSEHGAFAVGVAVEIKGTPQTDGSLLAAKIESQEGSGAAVPALEFKGTVDALPSGTTGLIGVWKIAGKLVNVTAATEIKTQNAALAVGVTVMVEGWQQADQMIEAREIETVSATTAATTTKAVEFVNAQLGHFFLTANAAEIQALDGGAFGGAWKRTGQSFNVGTGAASVCRFYGMPPKGPDSHFFTADAVECAKVMQTMPAWTFEGHAFSVSAPVGGACPVGTQEVHRFFNNPQTADRMNHRFTVTQQAFAETVAMGWTHEGVVMCAAL